MIQTVRPGKEILQNSSQILPFFRRWPASVLSIFSLLAMLVLSSSCRSLLVRTDNTIPRLATPLVNENFNGLTARLKQFTEMSALRSSRVTLQFFDARSLKRLPSGDAILVLQRPDKIRLVIQAPTIGTKVADMVSEANHFKVAIYRPEEYRRFLTGTNNADYSRMHAKLDKDSQQSALLNARPFHFTDALLIRPLHLDDSRFSYSLEESLLREPDLHKDAKKGAQVLHSFYVISEVELAAQPGIAARVRRRFWFDRTMQAQFVKQQVFDDGGLMTTEIEYLGYLKLNEERNDLWPGMITVSRPRDGYAARLTFGGGNFEVNPNLSENKSFTLENTEKLPETDLDKQP
jgi:hypothetical protein